MIGIFIFLAEGERLLTEVDELYRIIKSFLPVFVRAEIVLVEAPSDETHDARVGPANNTKSASTTGVIPDGNGSITYTDEYDGYANMMTGNQNPVHRSMGGDLTLTKYIYYQLLSKTFYYLLEWVRKTTESTEDTEKTTPLCALRVLCG